MLSKRKCCCGPAVVPGVLCGPICSACGGVHILSGGTITDANGSSALIVDSSFYFYHSNILISKDWLLLPAPIIGNDGCANGFAPYKYVVFCEEDQLAIGIVMDGYSTCDSTYLTFGYFGTIPVLYGQIFKTYLATPSNCNPITATFDVIPTTNYPLPFPGPTVTISIPVETPKPQVCCLPCPIPQKNLTLSWVNSMLGNGSTAMVFTPPNQWKSACANEILYSMMCYGGTIQFKGTYFVSGLCPTGQSQSCVSPGTNPLKFTLADYTANPFHLHYTLTTQECTILSSNGYSAFFLDE